MKIDELVVELGLDSTKFTDQQREAVDRFRKTSDELDKRIKGTEELSKKTGAAFGDMTHAAEGLFTAIAGAGMAAFARDTINTAAATGRMAVNIGVAASELSAFNRMIERNGGSADAASSSLKGFADQMQRLKWGQASPDFLMGLSQVGAGERDSPIQAFLKLARFAERNSVQDVNLAGQRLGFSQDVINVAIKGSARALEEYKRAFDGATSPEQVDKLTKMQESWAKVGQAVKTVGTDVVANAEPAFTQIANAIDGWVERNRKLAASLGGILAAIVALGALKPAAWILQMLGLGALVRVPAAAVATGAGVLGPVGLGAALTMTPTAANEGEQNIYENGKLTDYGRRMIAADQGDQRAAQGGGGSGAFATQQEKEAFIRASARSLGIDPDVAMRVAKSEGFYSFKSQIPGEQSFGAFQLHVTPGGRGRAVGDQFRERTGLDPSDPTNERETILFALQWAKSHGWRNFHGAARVGVGEREGIGGGDVTIGQIVLPNVTDAQGFARDLPGAMRNGSNRSARDIANNANTGLRP